MKKKFLIFALIFAVVAILVVVAYFAFFKVDLKDLAIKNTSEMGEQCFSGKKDMTILKLMTGQRENPYSLNGKHEENKDFALLIFKTAETNVESPTYIININGTSYNGILEQNPYDNTFVADLGISVPQNAEITATVAIKNTEYEFELSNINSAWQISFEKAREIGIVALKEDLENCLKGKDLNCELYVKAITDTKGTLSSYFYHVSFIDSNGNSKGVVIDVNTGEILK